MKRALRLAVMGIALWGGASTAWGQADAKAAYEAGKTAYQAGDFQKAREQFQTASQTDVKNPEVFLWLGKAHYQLGELDPAITAWTNTLKLAPEEPYARKMLAALRGELGQIENTSALIDILLRERLYDPALMHANKLLADKGLNDAQRVKAMTQKAEALLGLNKPHEVPAVVHELLVKYPQQADAAQTTLLLGRAYLHMKGENAEQGLALLRKVQADHANTPAAAVAQLELVLFDLDQGVTAARVDALSKWVTANAQHTLARTGRARLVDVYLTLAAQAGPPTADAVLSKEDTSAIATAAEVYRRTPWAAEAEQLTKRIIAHLENRYFKNYAFAAAITGVDALLKAELPRSSRKLALDASASFRGALAVHQLSLSIANTGGAGLQNALPQSLADVVAIITNINQEFAGEGPWKSQAAFAENVRQLAAGIAWPVKPSELKAPLAWSVQIAIPIVRANSDQAAIAQAINTLSAIVSEIAALKEQHAAAMAASVNAQLLVVLSPQHPQFPAVVWRQADLLDTAAVAEMTENLRLGRAEENTKLNAHQQQLIAVLGQVVANRANDAPRALEKLTTHLQHWTALGHYKLATDAYAQLQKLFPAAHQKHVRLAIVRVNVQQAGKEHERLFSAGLTPPRRLDPLHQQAIEELYAMHEGVAETDPLIVELRNVWNAIIVHYKQLEYFEIAEAAIKIKPQKAVAAADAFAQLQHARHLNEQAGREMAQVLKQLDGAKKLTLTPAWRAAIDAYQKFITDHPTSPFVDQAVDGIFNIAKVFEQHQAFDVAADVYRGFTIFASKQKALAASTPTSASVAERSDFAVAAALDAKARQALGKMLAERKPDSPPPAKISDEFSAAVAAFKDFIKNRPNGVLLGQAIQRIMAVALEYAQVDAWDVADGILADLLGSGLALKNPERIEFSRAICQVGKGIPDHAKQLLRALILGAPAGQPGDLQLGGLDINGAVATTPPALDARTRGYGMGGGGWGGGGLDGAARPLTQPSTVEFDELRRADIQALAAITQHESQRAARVAQLRDKDLFANQAFMAPQGQQPAKQMAERIAVPVLSEAEIARLESVFDTAYKALKAIRDKYPTTITSDQARGEILIMITHWRTLGHWQRAATLAQRFLADTPTDVQVPQIRLQIARDFLSWAAQPLDKAGSKQTMLAEVISRFEKARAELSRIVADFADNRALKQQAQWDIATSYLAQARAVDAFSPTLARGQYVRAAKELQRVASTFTDHPNIAAIPQLLWQIASELHGRAYFEEAIIVWNDLINFDPTHDLAKQAAPQIAATYQNNLARPLKAVEAYLEINFARGGNDQASQNAIFQIGTQLKNEKRWVEALSVLETFVDSFPRHANAGQALNTVGQIHQANEAWQDAITAYKRVISEFPSGNWVQEAKWAIAECTINLSQWREAMAAYEGFVAAYPQDPKVGEANRRIGVLKDLARYQSLVDEPGQRKSFDAQFQIATIVQTQLANPQKAIIEFRKVSTNWPQSHLADDALFAIGSIYLERGETDKARQSLLAMATQYPDSTLADDALLLVGRSYEDESQKLAGLTRGATVQIAQEKAQKEAYRSVQQARSENRLNFGARIQELKKSGKADLAEIEEANVAAGQLAWNTANFDLAASKAAQDVESLSAVQLADRQDKINAALRKAVEAYSNASKVPGADKAGDALLRMAVIFDEQLKDSAAALSTWQEIVRQFSGTAVAEEASWRIAQYHDRAAQWTEAVEAYKAFLRNYRRSPKAGQAQFNVAEGYEHLNKWVEAMDAYTNYITSFPEGPLVPKAKEQINWIKTYRL